MAVTITIDPDECIDCGLCVSVCPVMPTVLEMEEGSPAVANPEACDLCMLCVENCPTEALKITGTFEED